MATDARRLRVVSWNIHGCQGSDRRYDPGRVAAVLARLDADVIGLQEVDWRRPDWRSQDQFVFLASELGMAAQAGPNLADHRGHYGNGLLTRLPIRQAARIDLACPGREPRGAIDAALGDERFGVRVVVTHLGLAARERAEQLARLRGALSKPRPVHATVLLGDMNEWLFAGRLARTLTPRPFARMIRARTFPALAPCFALDCLFVDPAPAQLHWRTLRGMAARLASDHLPVVADIIW